MLLTRPLVSIAFSSSRSTGTGCQSEVVIQVRRKYSSNNRSCCYVESVHKVSRSCLHLA